MTAVMGFVLLPSGLSAKMVQAQADVTLEKPRIVADARYSTLCNAEWEDGETEIGGIRYRRSQCANTTDSSDGVYHRGETFYSFFQYQPVKWRVLDVAYDHVALLLSDEQNRG